MARKIVTPLQPKKFFKGVWKGEGELSPHPLLKWVLQKEQIRYLGKTIWLSDKVWMVKESFKFSSGNVIERTMFVEIIDRKRLHVTADDMPLDADIFLHKKGFRFTPYYVWARHRGRKWQLKCLDKNVIDENGAIHDMIRMFFLGFQVATMFLTVHRMTR